MYIKKSAIKDEKLFASFANIDLQSRGYIQEAMSIVQDMREGKEIDSDRLAMVRDEATQDRDILKGDFVIQAMLDFMPFKPKPRTLKKGSQTDKIIELVFIRERDKEQSISAFCGSHGLTRTKYYRIRDMKYDDPETRDRILKIRQAVYAVKAN